MNTVSEKGSSPQPANPYLAGFILGLALLASFLLLGTGLGASAGLARLTAWCGLCVAPGHFSATEYFGAWGTQPLNYYLVFMLLGTFLGGMVSALLSGRHSLQVERGQACPVSSRLLFALIGGVLAGFASRLAQGCTSGQALTGSALLLTGSLIYLGCVFAGGYAAAWFFRRQWHD
ncbi:MAG: YeeE/YedE family protein [Candidatus Riflebacteria bacterium]|nr:YeeE/YedE family protein [Candidatus Riflebacteria bacterium]